MTWIPGMPTLHCPCALSHAPPGQVQWRTLVLPNGVAYAPHAYCPPMQGDKYLPQALRQHSRPDYGPAARLNGSPSRRGGCLSIQGCQLSLPLPPPLPQLPLHLDLQHMGVTKQSATDNAAHTGALRSLLFPWCLQIHTTAPPRPLLQGRQVLHPPCPWQPLPWLHGGTHCRPAAQPRKPRPPPGCAR